MFILYALYRCYSIWFLTLLRCCPIIAYVPILLYTCGAYMGISMWVGGVGTRTLHIMRIYIYIQSLSWYWAMFSLDRERYNLQNQCVRIYIYAPCTGTDYMPKEGVQRTAPCCEGVYILCVHIYIHYTYIRTSIYFNILYLYNIHTCAHTHTHTYTFILPPSPGCVRARKCVCVCVCVCRV